MSVASDLLASQLSCPSCGGSVDVKSRHVAVSGGAVRVYCSAACLEARDAMPIPMTLDLDPIMPVPRRRWRWWVVATLAIGATALAMSYVRDDDETVWPTPELVALSVRLHVLTAPSPPPPPVTSVVSDRQHAEDEALLADLMHDTWLHPLAGPVRRMPRNHTGAFGAVRPGDRAAECLSGHCGVDIGWIWGEPIHAVHDGVVDWVNRGPNEENGGVFVKLAHRGGTVFTWYFHLAAVPRWVHPGVKVTAGQVIGLLGDTGIKQSEPHLHFAMTVKPSTHDRERYLDPEPLIALWPLWIPKDKDDQSAGRAFTAQEPGLPVREHAAPKPRHVAAAAADASQPASSASSPGSPAPSEPAAAAEPSASAAAPGAASSAGATSP